MKYQAQRLTAILILLPMIGCSTITLSEHATVRKLRSTIDKAASANRDRHSDVEVKIANPPARTLRFDGHEIVLGQSENEAISTQRLLAAIQALVREQKMQSAAQIILLHRESAERLISEQWASGADDQAIQLVANVLSTRATSREESWATLVAFGRSKKSAAIEYQNLRNAFAEELQTNDPSDESAERLMQAAIIVAHPLARVDALRLLGLRELVAGRNAWAESQFRQAIEVAIASGNPMMAAELWLTVAESARRGNQAEAAASAWSKAIQLHLDAHRPENPLDVSFWLLAEKTRQETSDWPGDINPAVAAYVKKVSGTIEGSSSVNLWTAVADAQFQRGQWQSALINFKRAETLAKGDSVMWLRIAQAKCMAAMGQAPAASAILSAPAASPDPAVSAAATAAMGSIKLQTGAFQQGAQLLHKAITQSPLVTWPNKNQSIADLAIAQLIFGDTDVGLAALHEAQKMMEKQGERELLVRSLENELRLMEHEGRLQEISSIKTRIVDLERL